MTAFIHPPYSIPRGCQDSGDKNCCKFQHRPRGSAPEQDSSPKPGVSLLGKHSHAWGLVITETLKRTQTLTELETSKKYGSCKCASANLANLISEWLVKYKNKIQNSQIPTLKFVQLPVSSNITSIAVLGFCRGNLLFWCYWNGDQSLQAKGEESCSHMQCHTDEVIHWHNSKCCQLSKAICSQQT